MLSGGTFPVDYVKRDRIKTSKKKKQVYVLNRFWRVILRISKYVKFSDTLCILKKYFFMICIVYAASCKRKIVECNTKHCIKYALHSNSLLFVLECFILPKNVLYWKGA